MFFGSIVKPGSKTPLPSDCGAIFHLSQACLSPASNNKTYLQIVSPNHETVNLCALKKDFCEHATFDLFVPAHDEGTYFTVKGDSDVHIAGYFEPEPEPELDSDVDDEDSDVEVNEAKNDELMKEIQKMPGKRIPSLLPATAEKKGQKLAAALKKSGQSPEESDDKSDDDEELDMAQMGSLLGPDDMDSDQSEDDDEDNDEDDEDDDDDEVDADEIARAIDNARKANAAKRVTASAPPATTTVNKKRKPDSAPPANVAPKKKAKKDTSEVAMPVGDDEQYQKGLVEYLKAHGKTPISQLGGAVKRPNSIKKLGAFIKERSGVFSVQGTFVTLK